MSKDVKSTGTKWKEKEIIVRKKTVNVDDLDTEAIERKYEMMSAECVEEMEKNFGALDRKKTPKDNKYIEYLNFKNVGGKNMDISETVKQLISELDPEKFSETIDLLEAYQYEEFPAYELASELTNCDRAEDMPQPLFDLIVSLFEAEIEDGNAEAMNDLGALYYCGRGCEQDFTKAMYYYNMAAENGSRIAQENLGYCYYYGRNVPINYEKAFHYFALGAFDGHLISLYKIGDMYQNGYYVKKNPKEAFYIYERCIETMTDAAAEFVAGPVFLRLGNALLNGNGTTENAKRALICFQKAEAFLYDMVANGDVMYKKSLQGAIDGQTKAREKLAKSLPDKLWLDGQKD